MNGHWKIQPAPPSRSHATPATIASMCSLAPGSTSVTWMLNGSKISRTHATTSFHTESLHRNSGKVPRPTDDVFVDELSFPTLIVQSPTQRLRYSTFEK